MDARAPLLAPPRRPSARSQEIHGKCRSAWGLASLVILASAAAAASGYSARRAADFLTAPLGGSHKSHVFGKRRTDYVRVRSGSRLSNGLGAPRREAPSPVGFAPKWLSFRPLHSASGGAAVFECREVDPERRKFYLYEFEFAKKLCKSGADLLEAIKAQIPERRQQLGSELFLHQQLQDHPWRTTDPSEAFLFVIPSIFGVPKKPGPTWQPYSLVCDMRMEDLVTEVTKELMSSRWYHRNQGRDHLMAMMDWKGRKILFHAEDITAHGTLRQFTPKNDTSLFERRMATLRTWRHTARNFLIASRFSTAQAQLNGDSWNKMPEGARLLAIPYLPPSVIDDCKADGPSGKIVCLSPQDYTNEKTFDAYRRSRNTTLFFLGHGCRAEAGTSTLVGKGGKGRASSTALRPLVLYQLGDVRPPNILANTGKCGIATIECSFKGGGPTSGCSSGNIHPSVVAAKLRQTFFSVHVRGDDASSSRVYEALAYGTPQLFLAARYYQDVAPFKCSVPYDRAFVTMDEDAFADAPRAEMEAVLGRLMDGADATEWEQLWTTQRKAAEDLLWHVPNSRVGHNIVEDALRILSEESLGGV